MFYWSDANSTWIKTSCIRVSSENANIVRLQAQRSVAAQHLYTKGEPHEAAAASGAHEAAAAFGAMRVDHDEEVEDETILQDFQKNTIGPWLQGLIVTGEAKRTLAHELEQVLLSKIGNDQDRLRDAFKRKVHGFRAPKQLM